MENENVFGKQRNGIQWIDTNILTVQFNTVHW